MLIKRKKLLLLSVHKQSVQNFIILHRYYLKNSYTDCSDNKEITYNILYQTINLAHCKCRYG